MSSAGSSNFTTRYHKSARSVETKSLLMPIIACGEFSRARTMVGLVDVLAGRKLACRHQVASKALSCQLQI